MGPALEPTVLALKAVVREDKNVFCVGFAMDALNRLAHLPPEDERPCHFSASCKPIFRRS